jgi:hypothetical protein
LHFNLLIINVENNPAESAYSFYPNPTKDIIYYISNSKIDASWKQPSFKAVEVNKNFQFSTSGTSACDPTAMDGCVAFRFVSKYDCQQVSGLVALVDSAGNTIASLSAANSNISQGVPFEIKFNLAANSDEVVDTNLLDLKCFR